MTNSDDVIAFDSLEEKAKTTPSDDSAASDLAGSEPAQTTSEESSAAPLAGINQRIETLATLLEEANRLSTDRERIIDRLHQENQSLRQGELQHALLPVLRDSIRLFDDLKQTALNYAERDSLVPANVARDFECFAETVYDILYRHGIESYSAVEGDVFNSKEHRVVGVVQTHEKEKDRIIKRTIREGFRSNHAVVRLLEAEVYRYVPDPAEEKEENAAATQ